MHLNLPAIFYAAATATVILPIVVTGRPQIHLGSILIEKTPESLNHDASASKPSRISMTEGELKVIPKTSGYIQVQIYPGNTNFGGELGKIHAFAHNFSLTIPASFGSSENTKLRNEKMCDGNELVLYEPNGKCYKPGPVSPGVDSPCADEFMQFVELSDKPGYGECFCLQFVGTSTRPVVYWEKSNRCYWLYDQGPCEKGKWLVYSNTTDLDGENSLICGPRTCPENTLEDESGNPPKFWFEYNGKCLQTETENVEFCGVANEKIYFSKDKPVPVCLSGRPLPLMSKQLAGDKKYLSCKPGYKHLPNGSCKKTARYE